MTVCCVLSLESPHRGDSNEYTQYTIFEYEYQNDNLGSSVLESYGVIEGLIK